VRDSALFLSGFFPPTLFPPVSLGFTSSNAPAVSSALIPSPIHPVADRSSVAALVSGAIPAALIACAIVGALLLTAAVIGAVFLFRRRPRHQRPHSDSADAPRDLEFVDSTLHETLVTYSDAITVEGVQSDAIFTFPTDHSGI
jgi:hypothetical protein